MPSYFKTKAEIAQWFGVSVNTIGTWSQKDWWIKKTTDGWDVDALEDAVANYRSATDSQGRAIPSRAGLVIADEGEEDISSLQVMKMQAEISKLREEVRQKRHKNELNEQAVVDVDYVRQWASANILRLKQRLESFPDEFAVILPTELRSQGRTEAQTFIHELLLEISSWGYKAEEVDD